MAIVLLAYLSRHLVSHCSVSAHKTHFLPINGCDAVARNKHTQQQQRQKSIVFLLRVQWRIDVIYTSRHFANLFIELRIILDVIAVRPNILRAPQTPCFFGIFLGTASGNLPKRFTCELRVLPIKCTRRAQTMFAARAERMEFGKGNQAV